MAPPVNGLFLLSFESWFFLECHNLSRLSPVSMLPGEQQPAVKVEQTLKSLPLPVAETSVSAKKREFIFVYSYYLKRSKSLLGIILI